MPSNDRQEKIHNREEKSDYNQQVSNRQHVAVNLVPLLHVHKLSLRSGNGHSEGYEQWNKWVFKCFLKLLSVAAEVTVGGRLFQIRAAVAPKAWSLTVKSLVLGTISCWLNDERRCCRESVSAAHWTSLEDCWIDSHKTGHKSTQRKLQWHEPDL